MPQLSLYIDDDTMSMLREESRFRGVSISRYASGLIQKGHESGGTPESGAWPPGYWESVYGCLGPDDDFALPDDPPIDFGELDRELGLVE